MNDIELDSDLDFKDIDFSDFDFNFAEEKEQIRYLDINAILLQTDKKQRITFNLNKQVKQIESLINRLPKENETFYFLSGKNGFSSIAIIEFISKFEHIKNLDVSTFRIGTKQAKIICALGEAKKIDQAFFITGNIKNMETSKYDYFTQIKAAFDKLGFKMISTNNHSKVLLFETDNNFYVCETSSNLNENPCLEQFSLSNSKELYYHYYQIFKYFKTHSNI